MKLRLLFLLIAAALQSCVETTSVRTLPDGTVITERRKDISEDYKHFAGDAIRHRLRMPQVQPTK